MVWERGRMISIVYQGVRVWFRGQGVCVFVHVLCLRETERGHNVLSPAMGLRNLQKIPLKSSRLSQDFPNMMTSFFRHSSSNLIKQRVSNPSLLWQIVAYVQI